MPRYTDFDAEIARLELALVESPDSQRQVVTRLPIELALRLMEDCKAKNLLPGIYLREIIENHYGQKALGVKNTLPPFARQVLDALRYQLGKSSDEVIATLLETVGMELLERIDTFKKKVASEKQQESD